MQVAASVYPASQPLSAYHGIYHPPLPNHDHELKRTYLGLLPPQQIIEICLTFDLHVSPYIKSTVWPLDLNGAIAGLRKAAEEKDDENTSGRGKDSNGEAIMDSLAEEPRAATPAPEEPPEKPAEEPRPPDKEEGEQTEEASADAPASTSTSSVTAAAASPAPAPATSTPVQAPAQASPSTAGAPPVPAAPALPHAYPHQPYGYTYPHAPYYPPPPAYPYSHPQYPSYPHQYPQAPGYPPPPTYHHPPAPHAPPAIQDVGAGEDLPSYEEMIVEALQEANDPEGSSQALQKAFKRGRLEKGTNNKYKLNPSWEGGSTSRRTTRRPQTQSSANNHTTSPFTHAPLVHHHQNQHPYSYGYPYSQHSSTAHARPQPPVAPQAQAQPPAPESNTSPAAAEPKTSEPPEGTSKDAYEAAQSILNAINFGDLLPLAEDDVQPGATDLDAVAHPVASSSTAATEAGATTASLEGSARAELQAQLVLLATQLTALAKLEDPEAPTPVITVSTQPSLVQQSSKPSYTVPTSGVIPTASTSASTLQHSVPQSQSQAQYQQQAQPPVYSPQVARPYQVPSHPTAQYQPTQNQYAAQYYSPQGSTQVQAPQSPAASAKLMVQPQQQPLVHVLQAHQSFSLPYQATAQRTAPSPQPFTPYTPAPPVPQYQKPQEPLQGPPMLGLQPPPPPPPPAAVPTQVPAALTSTLSPSALAQVPAPPPVSPWRSAPTQAPIPEVPPPQGIPVQLLATEPAPQLPPPPPPPAAAEGNEGEDTSFDSGSDTESDDDMEEVI
ncbi:hypothetical protein BKA70DRAFT_1248867 [Coprinopsis sp. MPI-PUGE-AT-0042]|nr:hypothetical protein BKA70DRAFT_1248867 [Coprinopsis sp. MPI-PUGE-AT-0042]